MSENNGGWNLGARAPSANLREIARECGVKWKKPVKDLGEEPCPRTPNGSRYRNSRGPERPRPGNLTMNLWAQRLVLLASTPRNAQERSLLRSVLHRNEQEIREHGFSLLDCEEHDRREGISEARELERTFTPPSNARRNVATGKLERTQDQDHADMAAIRAALAAR